MYQPLGDEETLGEETQSPASMMLMEVIVKGLTNQLRKQKQKLAAFPQKRPLLIHSELSLLEKMSSLFECRKALIVGFFASFLT